MKSKCVTGMNFKIRNRIWKWHGPNWNVCMPIFKSFGPTSWPCPFGPIIFLTGIGVGKFFELVYSSPTHLYRVGWAIYDWVKMVTACKLNFWEVDLWRLLSFTLQKYGFLNSTFLIKMIWLIRRMPRSLKTKVHSCSIRIP